MTQGLQISVLFSSADNMLSIDATAANLSQTSPELQQQAERFRQVLASEQADGTVRQDFAAVKQDAGHGVSHHVTPALPGKDTQLAKAAIESTETNLLPAESDEPSDATDAAGELLGLIQRANLTASQLQKKAAAAAELHQLVPQVPLDKAEPVEDELSDLGEMAVAVATDKDLTGRIGVEGQSHTKLKAVTPLLPEYTITPVPGPVVTTDNDTAAATANSENAIQGATRIQTQPVMPVDTLVPEDGLTPEPEAEPSEVISAATAKAQQIETEQKRAGLTTTEAKPSAQVAQSEGSDSNFTQTTIAQSATGTAKSAREVEKLASAQVSVIEKTAPDDALTPISAPEIAVSTTASAAQLSEMNKANLDTETPQQPVVKQANSGAQEPASERPVSANSTAAVASAEIAEISQPEAISREIEAVATASNTDPQAQLVFATTKSAGADPDLAGRENVVKRAAADSNLTTEALSVTQAAVQSDAVAGSALSPADTGTNQEAKASRLASQPQNQTANNNDALKIDTNTKATADERGAEQGTEQRLFQPSRLDVMLATGSSGPSSTQAESFQQQLARFEATVASAAAAQRGADKTPVPELSARLKQLNLQQQDAAGQLRERVQLMVRQNIQVAEIRLDPAELGQMQIRINLQQEQASVQFIVQQQQAKELLEQQMPRLREMLQQQGIQLGEGQVQQQSRQQGNGDGSQRQAQTANQSAESFSDDLPAASTVEVQHRERLVDYYA